MPVAAVWLPLLGPTPEGREAPEAGGLMRDFIHALTARMGINGLGRALGLNGSSVLAWQRGESLPTADRLGPLARLAQVKIEDLQAIWIREQERRGVLRSTPRPPAQVGRAVCWRCSHVWEPRTPQRPTRCAKCGDPYYDRPRILPPRKRNG